MPPDKLFGVVIPERLSLMGRTAVGSGGPSKVDSSLEYEELSNLLRSQKHQNGHAAESWMEQTDIPEGLWPIIDRLLANWNFVD